MAMNRIQFQRGLSMPDFMRCFGTEAQCAAALELARWPDGFVCARCESTAHCVLYNPSHTPADTRSHKLFQCNGCRHQTSLIAGTVFENTKLPLTLWFLGMHLLSQAKTGLSALALKRQLGVSYPTAWLMHHKLMGVMAAREDCHLLRGQVQMDDAYLGGERAGGKPGRGSENKVPFVAAVSVSAQGHPSFIKLTPIKGFTRAEIGKWAKAHLAPGASVLSDGLACFKAVTQAECFHEAVVVGALKPRELPRFKWVNTILGNLKTSLAGCHHAFGYSKYAAQYLAAFAYRFNRRYKLDELMIGLMVDAAHGIPRPLRSVRRAEAHC